MNYSSNFYSQISHLLINILFPRVAAVFFHIQLLGLKYTLLS